MDGIFCQTVKRALPGIMPYTRSLIPYLIMFPAIDVFRFCAVTRVSISGLSALIFGSVTVFGLMAISILCALKMTRFFNFIILVFDLYGALSISSVVLHIFAISPEPGFLFLYHIAASMASLLIIVNLTHTISSSEH